MSKEIVPQETAINILNNIAELVAEMQAPYKVHQERIDALRAVVNRLNHLDKKVKALEAKEDAPKND